MPPFAKLWRYLPRWNEFEFESMSDSADPAGLTLLLAIGAGLALAGLFWGRPDLIGRLAPWVALNRPDVWKDLKDMAEGMEIDYEAVAALDVMDRVVRLMDSARVAKAVDAGVPPRTNAYRRASHRSSSNCQNDTPQPVVGSRPKV